MRNLLKLFEIKYPNIKGCSIEYIKRDETLCRYVLQVEQEQPYISSYERYLTDREIIQLTNQ